MASKVHEITSKTTSKTDGRKTSRKFFWLSFPGALGLCLLLAGCASEHPLDTLTRDSSPDAKRINDLFFAVLAVAILVGILVLGAVVYLIWRFRAKAKAEAQKTDPYDPDNPNISILDSEELPTQNHGNIRLEITWTIVPAVILIVVAVFTLVTIFEITKVTAEDDDLRVDVVGQQWWWEFHYHLDGDRSTPPDFVTANDLVIPIGQQVPLEISARDVIHSFWIPRLNGKMDAVPGREHAWNLEASNPGVYAGQCTEFCGLSHGYMKMQVIAMEAEDWVVWAVNQRRLVLPKAEGEPGYEGEQLFINNCARCHSVAGVTDTNNDEIIDDWEFYDGDKAIHNELISGAAPNLTHFASRTSFAGSIFDTYLNDLDDQDYLNIADTGEANIRDLRSWISNAPDEKPAAADESRGMPAFPNLTNDDIELLIEYLMTLK